MSHAPIYTVGHSNHPIEAFLALLQRHDITIMCAEKDPLDCHRTILVARELVRRGTPIAHILATGEIEPHADAMARLRGRLNIDANDLFGDPDEQAYELRARQIAYVAGK